VKSWSVTAPPALPGQGRDLRLFDTATQRIEPTSPGATARMYVCGITPYDATHMGHAFTYVSFDTLQRVWRDGGHRVQYVQNVTDIDDPLLERAVARGEDWRVIADRETALFAQDMAALHVLPPDMYVGAVESIPSVAQHVLALQEKGAVYAVDGDLYFDVHTDPHFGNISHLNETEMIAVFRERGGDPDRPGKRHPLDSLVWQDARPDEPAWDTPLGHGRPGWHIECCAIALDHLGMTFDVQGGGSDLIFPHHEMSASQGQVLTGTWPFARRYVHCGMVGWQGHKMSKSRGNLIFVSALRQEGHDPRSIRLALLAHHYRSDWTWSEHGLAGAHERLEMWQRAVNLPHGPDAGPTLDRVREVLSDDLRTPSALDAIDQWAQRALSEGGADPSAPQLIAKMCDALLGIDLNRA